METLQAEHEIQTALYAFLSNAEYSSYRLFNIKTGEIREMVKPSKAQLEAMTEMLLEIKISDTPEASEEEFLAESELPDRPPPPAPRQEDLDDLWDL